MNLKSLGDAKDWFEILQTSGQCQTALMTLKPGGASGAELNAHEKSEQVLLVLEGEVEGEIGGEKCVLRKGDTVVILPGVKHRFQNMGKDKAVTFNVYAPPEYPA
ncbi:MAG TPA: cupin domain-containing protein [Chthoniobacterales bacterium]